MSLNGTQSFGALCVVYKTSGHLKWVSFCLLKTTSIMRTADGGRVVRFSWNLRDRCCFERIKKYHERWWFSGARQGLIKG